jgi:hypothetical protein
MDTNIKNYLGYALIAALVGVVLVGFWYVSVYGRSVQPIATFSSTGESKVVAIPDVAQFSFSVITEGGKDLGVLQTQNVEKSNKIIAFLKTNGVEAKDIKTQNYDVQPRYQYYPCQPVYSGGISAPCKPSEIVGYAITQSVLVKARKFDKLGELLSGVVTNGGNNVSGLSFTIDNPDEYRNQARAEAIAEARARAEAIAYAGGFRLGRLISINEGGAYPIYYRESYGIGMGGDAVKSAPAPMIEPGSEDVNVTVTVVYEIR